MRDFVARWWIQVAEARGQWDVFVDMVDYMKGSSGLMFVLTIN
jgi:hypothetical protein